MNADRRRCQTELCRGRNHGKPFSVSPRLRGEFLVVSPHPTIDRTIAIDRFRPGGMIRGDLLLVEPGGKGNNIARDLARLGRRVHVLGFLGRSDEDYFLGAFDPARVKADFIAVDSPTRQHITLIETAAGSDTHVTSGKMRVRRADISEFMRRLRREARPERWAVFSGSLPGGMTGRDFARALDICRSGGARLCVDTSGPMLRAALEMRPWALKPNLRELEELTGRRLPSLSKAVAAAGGMLDRCPNVLVSLGADGAVLVTNRGVWHAKERRPKPAVSTVGAGDALFSGFLSASATGRMPDESLRLAVACGSACAGSRFAALQSLREVRRLAGRVLVKRME